MNDYRALHDQYAQGMQQPSTVMPNRQPGFNFLQGWNTSPSSGYLPPMQARQQPRQYGMAQPSQGQQGMQGQQMQQGPRARNRPWLLGAVQRGVFQRDQQNAQQMQPQQPVQQQPQQPMQPDMQANYGMQQPYGGQPMPKPYGQPSQQLDQYGKPIPVDQINPGRNPNLWGGG